MRSTLVLVMILGASTVRPVLAQTAPEGAVGRRSVASANVELVISGVGDRGEPDEIDGVHLPNPSIDSRFYTDVRSSIQYLPLAGRLSAGFGASTAVRRYSTGREFMVVGHSVGARAAWAIGRTTAVAGSFAVGYLPSYSLIPVPVTDSATPDDPVGVLPVAALDYSIANRAVYTTQTTLSASHQMSRRLTVDFSIASNARNFTDPLDPDLTSGSISAKSRFRLNRFAALRLGYTHQLGAFNSSAGFSRVNSDGLDVGIDYSYGRSRGTTLALTRSTSLAFATGLAISGTEGSRHVAATGTVKLTQKLGPLGQANIGYSRGLQLDAGLTAPSVGNAVTLGGEREITPSLRLKVQLSFNVNNVGLSPESYQGQYITYAGSTRVTYVFLRQGRVYGQYLTHGHEIDAGVETLGPVRRQQPLRHSFQIGVQWMLPLITARSERN